MSPQVVDGLTVVGGSKDSLLPHVVVVSYGVLGTQLKADRSVTKVAPEPDADMVVVDPAGLKFIQTHGPALARGASGSIYEWVGIKKEKAFPEPVRESIKAPCQAKFYQYEKAKQVIHVVGPSLHGIVGLGAEIIDAALDQLAAAYAATLLEFLASEATTIRLLPISGGIFAGRFAEDMSWMTFAALDRGFGRLTEGQREEVRTRLGSTKVELCIFSEEALDEYAKAFSTGGAQPEGGPRVLKSMSPGVLALISGLESDAAKKFNGTICTVLKPNAAPGKTMVELEGGSKGNLPDEALTLAEGGALIPGARATVSGLAAEAAKKYNGTQALLHAWIGAQSKWRVQLSDGVKANIPPTNLRVVATEDSLADGEFPLDLF